MLSIRVAIFVLLINMYREDLGTTSCSARLATWRTHCLTRTGTYLSKDNVEPCHYGQDCAGSTYHCWEGEVHIWRADDNVSRDNEAGLIVFIDPVPAHACRFRYCHVDCGNCYAHKWTWNDIKYTMNTKYGTTVHHFWKKVLNTIWITFQFWACEFCHPKTKVYKQIADFEKKKSKYLNHHLANPTE